VIIVLTSKGIKNAPVPFFIRPITTRVASGIRTNYLDANFDTTFSFLEEQIKTSPGGGKYLCGEKLTAADILISFPLIAAKGRGGLLPSEKYPKLRAYVDMLEEEEGYKKSIAKVEEVDGKFSAMI
jgi:glutathione S-transferase